jgi:hypothetical protein
MLTAITLRNFKGIREPVRVPIKPLTLLFGANSSGKSTVVQAIHYTREILERGNLNPDRTIIGGKAIDLGGFHNLVYGHDLSREIVVRYDLDLSDTDLPEYSNQPDSEDLNQFSRNTKSGWVEFQVQWSRIREHPVLTRYEVGLNDTYIAAIHSSIDESNISVTYNDGHHLLTPEGTLIVSEESGKDLGEAYKEWDEYMFSSIPLRSNTLKSPLPEWGMPLRFEAQESTTWLNSEEHESALNKVSKALVGVGKLLIDLLRGFRYLGPIRTTPDRNHQPVLTTDEADWAEGRAAWDALYNKSEVFLKEVNHWMSDARLKTGYSLRLKQFREIPIDSPLMIALVNNTLFDDIENPAGELEEYPIRKRIVLVDEDKGLEVLPQDIGVGISQVFPVIVVALDSEAELIAIEQPELHVHPAIQVQLGDLFISQIPAGKTFIIETHSEHLLLRIMRRIRETSSQTLLEEKLQINADEVAVLFVETVREQTIVREMPLNEQGELVKAWPGGFFEEGLEELF